MTPDDLDLTLRAEVAEVIADAICRDRPRYSPDQACTAHRMQADHAADALLPLLARVREQGEAQVRERVEAVLEAEERRRGADPVYQRLHPSQIRAALAEPTGERA